MIDWEKHKRVFMSSGALNIVHKVTTTCLIGVTAYGFVVFGDMGRGIVRRRYERWQAESDNPAESEAINIDLPRPTEGNGAR